MTPKVIVKGSVPHRLYQVVGYAILAALILWIATSFENFQILNYARVAADAVAILGLMIIIGYSGQVSIGQSFFFGLGAYVTAWLGVDKGWPFLLTLPVSAALGLLVGFVIGIPALRIRGLYLALVTLALAAVFPVLAKLPVLEDITGGANGKPADVLLWTEARLVPARHLRPGLAVPRAVRHRHGDVRHRLQHDEEPARPVAGGAARQRGRRRRERRVAGGLEDRRLRAERGLRRDRRLDAGVRHPHRGPRDRRLHHGHRPAHRRGARRSRHHLGRRRSAPSRWCSCRTTRPSSWPAAASCSSRASDGARSFLFFEEGDGPILASALYGILLIAVVFVMPGGIAYFVPLGSLEVRALRAQAATGVPAQRGPTRS